MAAAAAPAAGAPNPQDWTDTNGAALILGRGRSTIRDMVADGVLRRHLIGSRPVFWVPELREVREALERVARR